MRHPNTEKRNLPECERKEKVHIRFKNEKFPGILETFYGELF